MWNIVDTCIQLSALSHIGILNEITGSKRGRMHFFGAYVDLFK